MLVEPDGHTGSFNLYDKTTGQLIGTVSQAGQVTFVSSLGIGQPPTAVEQLKTLQDQQAEKGIIQQVFQLYFPNYNPDNSNPKSQKFGSSSVNNLAEIIIETQTFGTQAAIRQIELRFTNTDPVTGNTTPGQTIFYNTKAIFTASSVQAEQSFTSEVETFRIADVVHITDPDIGSAPFYDEAVPFVAGSAVIKSAVSTNPHLDANFLTQFLHIDQTTGVVSFDRLGVNFLGEGESVTFMLEVTSRSGPDTARVIIPITVTGDNDLPNGAPTIVPGPVTDIAGAVKEDTHVTPAHEIVSNGTITFQDVDLTDGHVASVVFTSSCSSLPGFAEGAHLGCFTLDPAVTEDKTDTINTGTVGWHFKLDDNDHTLQSLAEGQTITQVYTITITDDHGASVTQEVTITITGTNDCPEIVSSTTPSPGSNVREDGVQTTSGIITFLDLDLIDKHTVAQAFGGGSLNTGSTGFDPATTPLGTLTLVKHENRFDTNDTGTVDWTFTLDNALAQQLAFGQVVTQNYVVTITDKHGADISQTITVTITGTNDDPTLAHVDAGTLVDTSATDTFANLTGHLTGADVDYGESGSLTYAALDAEGHSVAGAVTGHYGSLTVNANGTYTYVPDAAAINALQAGHYADTFTVETTDIHGATGTATFTVDVTGANDKPMLNVADQYVTEGVGIRGFSLTHTFTMHDLLATDADAGSNEIFTLTTTAQDGRMSLAGHDQGPQVTGEGTHAMSISGSLAALNAALTGGSNGLM